MLLNFNPISGTSFSVLKPWVDFSSDLNEIKAKGKAVDIALDIFWD